MDSTQHVRLDTGDGSTTPAQAALFYISLGWPVLPLHTPQPVGVACTDPEHVASAVSTDSVCLTDVFYTCDCSEAVQRNGKCVPGKHPRSSLVPHGVKDATLDVALATKWWTLFPHANVGVDLWRAKLIDVSADSVEWQAEFLARNRSEDRPRPTLVFASGGGDGHEHWLYRRGPSDGRKFTNVNRKDEYDILVRGYAVMPPSMHPSGRRYRWVSGIGVRTHA